MKLYLLTYPLARHEQISEIVVRASSETRARELTAEEAARRHDLSSHWLAPALTTCEEISLDDPEAVICVDFYEP